MEARVRGIDRCELELGCCGADGQRAVRDVAAVDEQMGVGSFNEDCYGVACVGCERWGGVEGVLDGDGDWSGGPAEGLATTQAEAPREGIEWAPDAGEKRCLVGDVGLYPERERPA